jgi:ketosteroid isomerase-like protein
MPNNSTSTACAPQVETSENNRQLVLRFLTHAFANQIEAALTLLTDDATWQVVGNPDRLKVAGLKQRSQIERLLKSVARMVPAGMQMTLRGTTTQGDRVAVEVEAEGLWSNGRLYRNSYHFLFELRDGSIMAVREYMDTLQVFDILRE